MNGTNTLMYALVLKLLSFDAVGQRIEMPVQEPDCREVVSQTGTVRKYRITHIVEDHGTGQRWLFARNNEHPSSPARMVPLPRDHQCDALDFNETGSAGHATARKDLIPTIRVGDRLIVGEHTAVSDASFEAIALADGAPGELISVRLKIGGRVLRAFVNGPHSALLPSLGRGD